MSECGNRKLFLRTFIPPQLFEIFKFLNNVCREMREKDTDLKTQLRFGVKDLEIFTKTRGSEDPYHKIPLEEVTNVESIPVFDHSLKWKKKNEHPPRRKIQYQMNGIVRPSLRKTHPMSRESSHEKTKQNKKTKRDNDKNVEEMDTISNETEGCDDSL